MDLGIKGRRAIVTGGSAGIGRAAARELLLAGVQVTICARDAARLEQTRKELVVDPGGDVLGVSADMRNLADVARLVDEATRCFGGVDILVNNAGTFHAGRFDATTDEGLQNQLNTKLFGFMRAIRLVSAQMREQRWGRIVNVIGGAGKEPDPYMLVSGITNSALLNMTKSLATEFGPFNVLVNAVCPGWVDTAVWRSNTGGWQRELGASSEEEARRLTAKRNSLGRFGRPEELANAIAFLCSERASYITGVSINVDGGRLRSLW
jgi:3-oxoacyl-[acyl-carrier protein] reductase